MAPDLVSYQSKLTEMAKISINCEHASAGDLQGGAPPCRGIRAFPSRRHFAWFRLVRFREHEGRRPKEVLLGDIPRSVKAPSRMDEPEFSVLKCRNEQSGTDIQPAVPTDQELDHAKPGIRGMAPGEAIPSEIELAARYKVSQGTVRKAIDELAAEKHLLRRRARAPSSQPTTRRAPSSGSCGSCPTRGSRNGPPAGCSIASVPEPVRDRAPAGARSR